MSSRRIVGFLLLLFCICSPIRCFSFDSNALASALLALKSAEEVDSFLESHQADLDPSLEAILISAGDQHRKNGDYQPAISIFEIVQKVATRTNHTPALVDSLNRISDVQEILGNHKLQFEAAIKALEISRKANYQPGIADALLNLGSVDEITGKGDEAMKLLQESYSAYSSLNNKPGMGSALNEMGNVMNDKGEYSKADDYYRRSLAIREEVGDKSKIATTLNGLAGNYYSQGNFMTAIEYLSRSLKQSEEVGDQRQVAAVTFNIGATYQVWGDYSSALEYEQRALLLMKELGLQENVNYILYGIGGIYKSLGNYDAALKYNKQGLEMSEKSGSKRALADGYCHIAADYFEKSAYSLAASNASKCVEIRQSAGLINNLPDALYDLGNIYQRQGDQRLAMQYFEKGLKMATEAQQQQNVSALLNARGYSHFLTGDFHAAAEDYNAAIQNLEAQNNRPQIATTQRNLGYLHLAGGQFPEARKAFEAGLALLKDMNAKAEEADVLHGLSEVSFHEKEFDKSMDLSSESLKLSNESNNPAILWQALTTLGKTQSVLGRPEEAIQSLNKAIAIVDEIRLNIAGGEEEQQRFFEDKLAPYDQMIGLLVQQDKREEALNFAERAKARVLHDVLENGKMEIAKSLTPQEQEQEQKWVEQLVSLNGKIRTENAAAQPNKANLAELNNQLSQSRAGYEAFHAGLYDAHPELKMQRGKTEPPHLRELENLLPAKNAFLEYTVTDSETFVFVVKRDANRKPTLNVYRIPISRSDLSHQVETFRSRLSDRNPDFVSAAQSLYKLLVEPAAPDLASQEGLVFIPDRELWGLPFHALMDPQGSYLMEEKAVSYVPSLTVLRDIEQLVTQKPVPNKTLLAFGNPQIATSVVARASFAYRDQTLAPIPETETEVRLLQKLYGSASARIYTGEAASEGTWKQEAGKFSILHLATHGILDSNSPLYSHVLLSHPPAEAAEDGLLEAWEIMQMNLSADLVVLSACETALGRIGAGEGMIGLSWAFFVAGSKATLVSQWKVESEATSELMLAFYQSLKRGDTKAMALHHAAQNLSRNERYRHPFYWAAFVLIGDPW